MILIMILLVIIVNRALLLAGRSSVPLFRILYAETVDITPNTAIYEPTIDLLPAYTAGIAQLLERRTCICEVAR